MAFKLTKQEESQRTEFLERVTAAVNELTTAREEAKEAINEAVAKLNETIGKYNNLREEVEAFRDEVVARLQEEYDNKSEKWQESERAASALNLISEWESLDVEELNEQDELELDDTEPDLASSLETLPSDASEN
jgi:type I site-specific restriction endonuclease